MIAAGDVDSIAIFLDADHALIVQEAATGSALSIEFSGEASAVTMDRLIAERFYDQVTRVVDTDGAAAYGGVQDDVLGNAPSTESATLSGGRGDDQITLGSTHGGTVLFSAGDGSDVLRTNFDLGTTRDGENILKLGAGLGLADLQLLNLGDGQFRLQVGTDEDGIAFASDPAQLNGSTRPFDRIVFSDGTSAMWSEVPGTSPAGLVLVGGSGDDTLIGGDGNDQLTGGPGNDVYVWGRGSGQDRIYNTDPVDPTNDDVVQILPGTTPADVSVQSTTHGLCLVIDGTTDSLALLLDEESNLRISEVRFEDATVWGWSTLQALALLGSERNDVIWGTEQADVITGRAGGDGVSAGGGNDRIDGGSGNDGLHGGDGDDTIAGGAGDDRVFGDRGNDVYLFNRGDGADSIGSGWWVGRPGELDTLRFGPGIGPSDVVVNLSTYPDWPIGTFSLAIAGSPDVVTFEAPVDGSAGPIGQVVFDDGTVWAASRLFDEARRPRDLIGTATDDALWDRTAIGASKTMASEVQSLLSIMAAFVPMDSTLNSPKTAFIDMPLTNPLMPAKAWM